jgi:hypothetical protein
MADYKRRIKSDNQNAQDVVGANYVLVDGSTALVTVVPTTTGCRLLRVINNTKGLSLNIRSGPRVVGTIATTSAEGPYPYGVYCDSGIQIDVAGSGGNATVVFST